jgi:hypothetical protein
MLVVVAVYIADALVEHVNFIPKWLVRLPKVSYATSDFWLTLQFFVIVHATIFILIGWVRGPVKFTETRRLVDELFAIAAAFAIASLLLFTVTSVAFSPNFVVGIVLITLVLFVGIFLVAGVARSTDRLAIFSDFGNALLKRIFSIAGGLVILLALSPGILAVLFVKDRDVANAITQVRIYFNQNRDVAYDFVNPLGGRTFNQPMLAKMAPNDGDTLWVLERGGRLWAVSYPDGEKAELILDINSQVGEVDLENGALGFAFDPDFRKKGTPGEQDIFLYYTSYHRGEQVNYLSRFTLKPEANWTEEAILTLPRVPNGFHNGGSVEFGPDGYLYLALGEGVRTNDLAPYRQSLARGILRLDVNEAVSSASFPAGSSPANG